MAQYCTGWWLGCWGQSGYSFGAPDSDYASGKHPGIDLGLPYGTPVYAAEPGTVVWAGPMTGLGNAVILALGDGTQVVFGHLSKLNVSRGDQAGKGLELGRSGTSGNSTGPHLHFEIRTPSTGQPINPLTWLSNHLDKIGLGGSGVGPNIGNSSSGSPVDQGVLGIPGAINTLGTNLLHIGWLFAGLFFAFIGFVLVIVPELIKKSPVPVPLP